MVFRGKNIQGQRKAFFARINALNVRANRLPIQFSIIVPSTKMNKKISASSFSKRVDSEKRFFSKNFGGDTSVRATGSFILKKGRKDILVKERSAIVESSTTPKVFNSKRKILIRHIISRKKEWKQDSIFFKLEGEAFIFPRKMSIPHAKGRGKVLIS